MLVSNKPNLNFSNRNDIIEAEMAKNRIEELKV